MFSKKAFSWIINFWNSLFMTAVMTTVFTIAKTGGLALAPFLSSFWKGFLLAYLVGVIIPLAKLGEMFAQKLGAKPDTLAFRLLSSLPPAAIMDTVMCLAFSFFAIGFSHGAIVWLMASLGDIPLGFVLAYPCCVVLTPLSVRLTMALTH